MYFSDSSEEVIYADFSFSKPLNSSSFGEQAFQIFTFSDPTLTSNLFQFDYQLECYVPEAKRRYGYFSLPLLYRDQFIGRMDCKAHRKSRHLEIKSLFIEQRKFDEEQIINTFVK